MNISRIDKRYIELIFLSLVLGVLYIPVFKDLVVAWNTKPEVSHGFLIIPIFIYLVWQKRAEINQYEPKGNLLGLIFVCFGVILYLIGSTAGISTFSNISFIINTLGIILVIGGTDIARILIFPVFFLIFMIPIPDVIYVTLTAPLKLFVSQVSVKFLQFIGIPVIGEGNIIHLANMTLEVVEACSGIRSLLSYLMIGMLLAYFLPRAYWLKRVFLVLLTFPVAIIINILRILITGILSNMYGAEAAEGFFHETSGVILFFIGIILLAGFYQIIKPGSETARNST